MKIYRISFEKEQMKLVKNRQYTNNAPLLFELSPKGTNKLISYLQKDIDLWFEEKMKMYYEGNKLIVIPDDSDVEPIA